MPHQCTSCGRVFPDGSKEMLSGCPDCGGNKFQFHPGSSRSASRSAAAQEDPPEASSPSSSPSTDETVDTEPRTGGERAHGEWPDHSRDDPAESATREPASSSAREPNSNAADTDTTSTQPTAEGSAADASSDEDAEVDTDDLPPDVEDRAQASARTDVVSRDELAHAAEDSAPNRPPESEGRVIEPSSDDRPGLDELREELNSQFESIKIVNPGQYELNLMELYDRQEYIISLQEDGRYVIEMPDSWGDREESD